MIQFENVRRSYGDKVAVAGLNLDIGSGELFAFLGPNGAGKTTTIKMIVGLLRPSSGTVRLCGHDVVADSRLANQLLGYVPDEPHLYDKLTGREFLQFIADMYGLTRERGQQQIAEAVKNFDLGQFADDLTESYSHGMKQRVAFAAAMLHEPAVLVIDEPMVGLDPRSVRMLKDLLQAKARSGTTIFMSTHMLSVAEEIADRVGIVDQGTLRFVGTMAELRKQLAERGTSLEQFYLGLTGGNGAQIDTAPLAAEPDPVGSASEGTQP